MICTFFGHRDTPKEIEPILLSTLVNLIENKNATMFYVGNNGNFDIMVRKKLIELKKTYHHINYYVVLSYLSYKKTNITQDYSDTIFPEELSKSHPRFAIKKRNFWMLNKSDIVIAYVKYSTGGAVFFTEQAKKRGKTVINIAEK